MTAVENIREECLLGEHYPEYVCPDCCHKGMYRCGYAWGARPATPFEPDKQGRVEIRCPECGRKTLTHSPDLPLLTDEEVTTRAIKCVLVSLFHPDHEHNIEGALADGGWFDSEYNYFRRRNAFPAVRAVILDALTAAFGVDAWAMARAESVAGFGGWRAREGDAKWHTAVERAWKARKPTGGQT